MMKKIILASLIIFVLFVYNSVSAINPISIGSNFKHYSPSKTTIQSDNTHNTTCGPISKIESQPTSDGVPTAPPP